MPVWRYSYTLLILLLLIISETAPAQEPPCLHFTAENGLPSNNVYKVYRDSKGFLWFATDKGVSCYNGLKFENYTIANGLADNEVFFFVEDYEHRLWMATYNGELCYYSGGAFHTAQNTAFLKTSLKSSFTKYIRLEADSSITFTFYDNNAFINIKGNKIKTYKIKEQDPYFLCQMYRKQKLAKGSFLLESQYGTELIDSNGSQLEKHTKKADEPIHYLFSQNQEYTYDNIGIYTKDGKRISDLPASLPAKTTIYSAFTDDDIVFVTTDNGLYIDSRFHFFLNKNVSSITSDNEGNYWITTLNDGAFYFPHNLNNKQLKGAYTGNLLSSFTKDKTCFFINNNAELFSLTNDTSRFLLGFNQYLQLPEHTTYQNLKFFVDSSNSLYLFSDYSFLIVADKLLSKSKSVTKKYCPEKWAIQSELTFTCKSLCLDGESVYIRRPTQIASLNLQNLKNDKAILVKYLASYNTQDRIFAMAKAQDNNIWYSTLTKLYRIEYGIPVLQKLGNNLSFKQFNFFGNYLVGYNQHNKLFVCKNVDKKATIDSIPDQNCVWDNFCQLDSIHILVSTNNLYRILTLPNAFSSHPSIRTVENASIPTQVETFFADSAYCYFFKKGDITKISISDILKPAPAPILFFRNIKTADNKYPINSTVNISYNESKNISIKIATLTSNNRNITYQYSISQNDTVWRNTTSDEINLANPTFGTYTIKVRAKTLSGGFSAPIEFKLIIARPFWATWWFICITLTALISVTILIIRYRIRLAYKKSSIEKEKEIRYIKSEFKALNALMNPHFIFNTLNNVQSLVNKDEKRAANEYIRIFADLVRQNMHNTSLELIPLQEEMELVGNYLKLEKLRYKELLNYTITIDEQTDINDVMVPPLLVQPLVENSIKHGLFHRKKEDSYILIDITEKDNKLTILVKDNGIGLSAAQQRNDPAHQSFGLENIRKRLHHASIIQNRKITLDLTEEMDEKGMHWTVVTIQIEL